MTDTSIKGLPNVPEQYSLWDRCLIWKDHLIAKREFQRIASRLPLVNRISKRRANQVFDLMAGFVYSQILLACVRVRLFEHLKDGPLSLHELAQKIDLPYKGLERLILAAHSINLLDKRSNDRFGLGTLGAPLVGNQALLAMIEHHSALYQDLRDPLTLLRGGLKEKALESYWPYITEQSEDLKSLNSAEKVAQYSELMSASLPLVADEIIATYSFRGHQCLLDVGGGQGTFITLLNQATNHLQLQLFDLPGVAQLAQETFNLTPHLTGVKCFGGDFFNDALPRGADIITLIRVLFDHDDARVKKLLHAVYQALPKGGKLLIAEPMAETPEIPAMGQAYFGFYLLAMGRGRPRSAKEIVSFLHEVGFDRCDLLKNSMTINAQILLAEK
jgi:demethylspheroidene O-methyltransferase